MSWRRCPRRSRRWNKEQGEITAQLGDTALYRGEPDKAKTLHTRYGAIEAELVTHLALWEALEAKQSC